MGCPFFLYLFAIFIYFLVILFVFCLLVSISGFLYLKKNDFSAFGACFSLGADCFFFSFLFSSLLFFEPHLQADL